MLDEVQGDEVLAPNLGVSGGVCRPGVRNAGMARIEVMDEVYVYRCLLLRIGSPSLSLIYLYIVASTQSLHTQSLMPTTMDGMIEGRATLKDACGVGD